ncbi:hypothetical protein [Micromonospora endolithica]|uniref:hypothetical protein n=1 Tax=Micromonospora endolithica TaxID=230091 RepID=UPI0011AC9042|nr:hypothetical protein [Micromonospora endolithica]TWJ23147.1 hypothetical protein JD76_03276 [Micromonospora endolithica]
MQTIIALLAWLTGRAAPTPSGIGPVVQRQEHEAARARLLDLARRRQAEYRYERRGR